ncbi:DUF4229 domain-containing protein [Kineococcus sp. T90]|nr:DUF4229 domain-containing protein [Kineococcus indalonis]
MRLGIFVLCLVVVSGLGAKGWLALLIAAVVSVLLSVVLLRRQREEMAARLQQHVDGRLQAKQPGAAPAARPARARSRFAEGVDEDNAAEDERR